MELGRSCAGGLDRLCATRQLAVAFALIGCSFDRRETSCFAPGTLIATPSGDVPIEQLRVGDDVLAFDHDAHAVTASKVTALHRHEQSQYGSLELPGGGALGVTAEHPIHLSGRYAPAGSISAGERLLILDGRGGVTSVVVSGEATFELTMSGPVYNISVSRQQNYFAAGVLVHNKTLPESDYVFGCDLQSYGADHPVCNDNDPTAAGTVVESCPCDGLIAHVDCRRERLMCLRGTWIRAASGRALQRVCTNLDAGSEDGGGSDSDADTSDLCPIDDAQTASDAGPVPSPVCLSCMGGEL